MLHKEKHFLRSKRTYLCSREIGSKLSHVLLFLTFLLHFQCAASLNMEEFFFSLYAFKMFLIVIGNSENWGDYCELS